MNASRPRLLSRGSLALLGFVFGSTLHAPQLDWHQSWYLFSADSASCLTVCLSACLPARLRACLPAPLPPLPACPSACLPGMSWTKWCRGPPLTLSRTLRALLLASSLTACRGSTGQRSTCCGQPRGVCVHVCVYVCFEEPNGTANNFLLRLANSHPTLAAVTHGCANKAPCCCHGRV